MVAPAPGLLSALLSKNAKGGSAHQHRRLRLRSAAQGSAPAPAARIVTQLLTCRSISKRVLQRELNQPGSNRRLADHAQVRTAGEQRPIVGEGGLAGVARNCE